MVNQNFISICLEQGFNLNWYEHNMLNFIAKQIQKRNQDLYNNKESVELNNFINKCFLVLTQWYKEHKIPSYHVAYTVTECPITFTFPNGRKYGLR